MKRALKDRIGGDHEHKRRRLCLKKQLRYDSVTQSLPCGLWSLSYEAYEADFKKSVFKKSVFRIFFLFIQKWFKVCLLHNHKGRRLCLLLSCSGLSSFPLFWRLPCTRLIFGWHITGAYNFYSKVLWSLLATSYWGDYVNAILWHRDWSGSSTQGQHFLQGSLVQGSEPINILQRWLTPLTVVAIYCIFTSLLCNTRSDNKLDFLCKSR